MTEVKMIIPVEIDAFIKSSAPDYNYGGHSKIYVGDKITAVGVLHELNRGLLRFQMPEFEGTVKSQQLKIYQSGYGGSAPFPVGIYLMKEAHSELWIEGTDNGATSTGGCTWKDMALGFDWDNVGGDFDEQEIALLELDTSSGWKIFIIPTESFTVESGNKHSFFLKFGNEDDRIEKWVEFSSRVGVLDAYLEITVDVDGWDAPIVSAHGVTSEEILVEWEKTELEEFMFQHYLLEQSDTGTGGWTTLATITDINQTSFNHTGLVTQGDVDDYDEDNDTYPNGRTKYYRISVVSNVFSTATAYGEANGTTIPVVRPMKMDSLIPKSKFSGEDFINDNKAFPPYGVQIIPAWYDDEDTTELENIAQIKLKWDVRVNVWSSKPDEIFTEWDFENGFILKGAAGYVLYRLKAEARDTGGLIRKFTDDKTTEQSEITFPAPCPVVLPNGLLASNPPRLFGPYDSGKIAVDLSFAGQQAGDRIFTEDFLEEVSDKWLSHKTGGAKTPIYSFLPSGANWFSDDFESYPFGAQNPTPPWRMIYGAQISINTAGSYQGTQHMTDSGGVALDFPIPKSFIFAMRSDASLSNNYARMMFKSGLPYHPSPNLFYVQVRGPTGIIEYEGDSGVQTGPTIGSTSWMLFRVSYDAIAQTFDLYYYPSGVETLIASGIGANGTIKYNDVYAAIISNVSSASYWHLDAVQIPKNEVMILGHSGGSGASLIAKKFCQDLPNKYNAYFEKYTGGYRSRIILRYDDAWNFPNEPTMSRINMIVTQVAFDITPTSWLYSGYYIRFFDDLARVDTIRLYADKNIGSSTRGFLAQFNLGAGDGALRSANKEKYILIEIITSPLWDETGALKGSVIYVIYNIADTLDDVKNIDYDTHPYIFEYEDTAIPSDEQQHYTGRYGLTNSSSVSQTDAKLYIHEQWLEGRVQGEVYGIKDINKGVVFPTSTSKKPIVPLACAPDQLFETVLLEGRAKNEYGAQSQTNEIDNYQGDLFYNTPPIAFLAAPKIGYTNQGVLLDGSQSVDFEGGSLVYIWDFGDSSSIETTDSSISHVYTTAGVYTVKLKVRDEAGLESAEVEALLTIIDALEQFQLVELMSPWISISQSSPTGTGVTSLPEVDYDVVQTMEGGNRIFNLTGVHNDPDCSHDAATQIELATSEKDFIHFLKNNGQLITLDLEFYGKVKGVITDHKPSMTVDDQNAYAFSMTFQEVDVRQFEE